MVAVSRCRCLEGSVPAHGANIQNVKGSDPAQCANIQVSRAWDFGSVSAGFRVGLVFVWVGFSLDFGSCVCCCVASLQLLCGRVRVAIPELHG